MPSDIRLQHPIFRVTPQKWHPWLRLARADRPVGIWLLAYPCWWGLALAGGGIVNLDEKGWLHALLFTLGAAVMRSAGCVVNDLWDMKLDAQVERTKTRPLAAGEITPRQALHFLAGLLGAGFFILLCLSWPAIVLGVLSLALVAAYPYMKRVTWWPQAFLGLTFNWGALMAFADITKSLPAGAFLLYAAGFFWTLAYDTVYAHQDKEDDARIGIRSTARLFGEKSKKYVAVFFGLAVALLLAAKYAAAPSFATPILILPLLWHAWLQVKNWDMDDAQSCLAAFTSNIVFGGLALLMLSL